MTENYSKNCPYCAEPIKAAAKLCPHCRSQVQGGAPTEAYRNRPGRQIAGVAIAIADGFNISVTFVRLLFIIFTFVSFVGPITYVAFWLLLPAEKGGMSPLGRFVNGVEGEPSILEQVIREVRSWFERASAWLRSRRNVKPTPPPPPPPTQNGPEKPPPSGDQRPAEEAS